MRAGAKEVLSSLEESFNSATAEQRGKALYIVPFWLDIKVGRGKTWRQWPEGLFNRNLGHKAISHPFHSLAHQMGNAGPSPSKHLLLLWPSFHSLALGRGTEELVFLIPGGIHLHPISISCTGVCAALVSFLLKLYFVNFPSPPSQGVGPCKVLKLEKVLLSLYLLPFPSSCSPTYPAHPHGSAS